MDRRKDGKMGEACTNVKDTPYAMEICIKCVYIYIYTGGSIYSRELGSFSRGEIV